MVKTLWDDKDLALSSGQKAKLIKVESKQRIKQKCPFCEKKITDLYRKYTKKTMYFMWKRRKIN